MFPENRLLELMIIGAIALIVVGPKDLPILMRRVGQFVGKMRGMANEFRASFEDLAHQSELEDLRKEVEAMRADHRAVSQFNPMASADPAPDIAVPEAPPASPVMTAIAPDIAVAEPAPPQPLAAKPRAARKPRAKAPPPEAS